MFWSAVGPRAHPSDWNSDARLCTGSQLPSACHPSGPAPSSDPSSDLRATHPTCVPPTSSPAGPQLRSACHPPSPARSLFQERAPNLTFAGILCRVALSVSFGVSMPLPGAFCVGPRHFLSLSLGGPALCVGFRRSLCRGRLFLCRGPALLVSGPGALSEPGAPLPRLSLSGPGGLCVGPGAFCQGPALFMLGRGGSVRSLYRGPAAGTLCVGPRRLSVSGHRDASPICVTPRGSRVPSLIRMPSTRATHPASRSVEVTNMGFYGPPAPSLNPRPARHRGPPSSNPRAPIQPRAFPFSRREPQTLLFGGKHERAPLLINRR